MTDHQSDQARGPSGPEEYRSLFDNAQVGLFRSRLSDGVLLAANPRLAEIFGYDSREEFLSSFKFSEAYVDPGARERMLIGATRTGVVRNYEARMYRRDGRIVWVRYSGRAFADQGFLEGVMADITEVKKAQAALTASEERYRLLTENVADGVGLIQDGRIFYANRAFARIFGYDAPGDLERTSVFDLAPPRLAGPMRRTMNRVLETEERSTGFRAPAVTKDGAAIWVDVQYSRIDWQERPAILVTLRDVTAEENRRREMDDEVARLRRENTTLRTSVRERYRLGPVIGRSPAMQAVYEMIIKAAATDANVIITGESGTGKDLVSRAIHEMSARAGRAFVPVNCGAIPETLMESEFFGHKKGAFTGAHLDKHGYLDLADGGTLFLDEVGELSPAMQVKLLRAIEGAGFTPVGGSGVRQPDVRVTAATNRDLARAVAEGKMREDFFYRIHVIPIQLPPLRDRRQDIQLLAEHFLAAAAVEGDPVKLPSAVMDALLEYDWPGNVRELQNVLNRYAALGKLDLMGRMNSERGAAAGRAAGPSGLTLQAASADFERGYILAELERRRWNRTRTAESLGISRRTLFRKMRELGI